MAFDGGFLHCVIKELNSAVQCHIDKIYQPSRDELILVLRKKGFCERLLLCARSGAARIQLTQEKYENPDKPPMFCMLARKHYSGARLTEITQHGLDRVAEFKFETTNEMGDRVSPRIVCELIGNKSNIILVGDDGRIIDAVRHSDIESSSRIIQPGAVYDYPEDEVRCNLLTDPAEKIAKRIAGLSELPVSKAVMRTCDGLSPLICRETAFLCGAEDRIVKETDEGDIITALSKVRAFMTDGTAVMLTDSDGTPADFSYMPIGQYGGRYNSREYGTFCELLDGFYSKREAAERIKRAAADIIKLTENLISRTSKRLAARQAELDACGNREELRIYGELIKANINSIKPGARSATVCNFYDENMACVTIPLDPALSAAANAAKYFKSYKKSNTAGQKLSELIQSDMREAEYLESVLDSIARCKTAADIAEIRDELRREGYIKGQSRTSQRKPKPTGFLEYVSREGYRIAVGRNNTQNDLLTAKTASKADMWFHVKNAPGSHVVVFSGGAPISDETLVFAARLAAENSKLSASPKAAVDYTPIKYVKKPNGAKAGMVIYTTNKTLFVTPGGV